jgi:hypothetical protein
MTIDLKMLIQKGGDAGCWIWLGNINNFGYGRIYQRAAHRVVYEALVGPIPENQILHHTCEVKACVNPRHMHLTTRAEHLTIHDTTHKRTPKTHCKRGHAYDDVNTYHWNGNRKCRACKRARRSESRVTS